MRHALNSLTVALPDWVLAHSHPDWLERYGRRFEDYRLPESKDERAALATLIGADGWLLLTTIYTADVPPWLRELPAVETLRQVWIQNYTWTDHGTLRWRITDETPPAGQFINSPYDQDARYSQKRGLTGSATRCI
jgi:transposase